jgi:hypothetical protein
LDSLEYARALADTLPAPNNAMYESLEWRLKHDSKALQEELDAKKPKD